MNVTRMTLLSSASTGVANINAAATQLASAQQEVSSGKRISTASDDPAGTVSVMNLQASLARSSQYSTNATDALAALSTADSAYSQSVSVLQKVQTLVLQAQNTGTADQTSQNAIAGNIDSLRSTLLSLANTTYNGQPVFGGTTAGSTAYDSDGTYVGTDTAATRLVSSNTTVASNTTGPAVFGSGDTDVFALLSSISSSLRSTGTVPSGALDSLNTAVTQVSSAQAAEGGAYSQVQALQTARTTADAAMTTRLSNIQDADLAQATLQLASANTAYQASLQTVAAVNRQSLLDYLN